MSKKEIKVVVQIAKRFVSVNSLYKARIMYVGGRPVPSTYKNPRAVEIEREIRDQLRAVDFSEYMDWLRETKAFKLHVQFIFKKNITNSDTSNYLKNLEDIFTRFIKEDLGIEGYDDSLHVEVSAVKSVIPKSKHEYACISLSESTFNIRLDQTEKPTRVFLGGTCGESDWRGSLTPELEKLGIEYFNPVVPDWTPECIEIENREKNELCNTHLYIITPEMKGVYSIAEMTNSVWECLSKGSGFVWIGILESDAWEEHQKKSLQATLDLINNIAQGNSRIRARYIKDPKEILIQ